MAATTQNRLESRYGGIVLEGHPHDLAAWFVVGLRLTMGAVFLGAGLGKVAGWPFDASGYLANVDAASPVSGLFGTMASSPMLMEIINIVIPVTQVLIGVALVLGLFVRLAALGGALQMSLFYLGSWDVGGILGFANSDLVYLVVFLALGAFAAGRILGLDRYLEQMPVDGEPLIERYPKLRFILG